MTGHLASAWQTLALPIALLDPRFIAAALLIGYLLGSIPFGLIFTRLGGYGDVRHIGSGNMGATNVLRTGSRKLAALTLLCDAAKAAIAVSAFTVISFNLSALAGFAAFLGHLFPVWLKFKGGKGVASYLGVLLALYWALALLFISIWLITAFFSRFSSLAALTAAFITPIAAFFLLPAFAASLIALMSALIFVRHKSNIIRLARGTENRIASKG